MKGVNLKKLNTSLSECNINKLCKTIFNLNENVDENIKNCPLEDLMIQLGTGKTIFDANKENIFTFPTILRRLQDYFSFKNPVFTVFGPDKPVSVNMFSIENKRNYFFLFKVKKDDESVKYTRDVLVFECVLDKIELPSIYRLITEDFYISTTSLISNALKVSSDTEKRSSLYPPQYVKGQGMDCSSVYKNSSNRVIVHVSTNS